MSGHSTLPPSLRAQKTSWALVPSTRRMVAAGGEKKEVREKGPD